MLEKEFHDSASMFLNLLFEDLEQNEVTLERHWDIDHICYRTSSDEEYEKLKVSFKVFSKLLIESEVNGRLIATFKLNNPITFNDWKIGLIELPAPKKGKLTPSGLEHIEVVCDVPFEDLIKKYSRLKLDSKGLTKDFNQELEVCLGERNVKFHQLSLESVINIEKNTEVWNSLKKTDVLKKFKNYMPLIAGTFPLNMHTANSDLDILMCAADLSELEIKLVEAFNTNEGFICTKNQINGHDTLICRFNDQNVPYEIFAQRQPSVLQTAYRHFLIEEKILKLAGLELFLKIQTLKGQGLKTEPAFAKLLNLSDDPYKTLVSLQEMPMADLQKFLHEKLF